MKWPLSVTVIRHGQSAYNALRAVKDKDPEYCAFKTAFRNDYRSPETQRLAEEMRQRYALKTSDYGTSLTVAGENQGFITGGELHRSVSCPDVILCSPYLRAEQTLTALMRGWRELYKVEVVTEDRIREQEHGLSLLYSDWRMFHTFHPEQKQLHDLLGPYWYQYPQGESVSQVRDRTRMVLGTLIREYAGKHVMLVTHHLTILSLRANLERLTPEQFIDLDEHEKPVNCGVTHYVGNPKEGRDGKLVLDFYNRKFY